MNATLPIPNTVAPPTATGPMVSPLELVRAMSPEDKQAVFLSLLREAVQLNGDSVPLLIDDECGKLMGYYLTPKAAAARSEAQFPKLPPEREAELHRRQREPDRMISEADFRKWLTQADPAESR